MDWMDFNRDGEVDAAEEYLGLEMMCSSREEHEALFGDAGLEFMDEDERREVLENAGLDPDDFDF